MTEPTDAVRVGRVLTQLRSVAHLHERELEHLADQLQAAGQNELAERLRVFRALQADEISVAIDELADMLGEPTQAEARAAEDSPRRARWLEEQEESTPQPLTRRELLNLGGESEPD